MKKAYLIAAFVITVILQLMIPVKMIYDSEITEKEGTEFKFKTIPVDPTDFLRGKYITLNYEISTYPAADTTFVSGEQVYVAVKKDKNGFAQIASIHHDKPEGINDYVLADVNYNHAGRISLEFAFNRFYMAENKAAEAETAYAEYSKKNLKPAYALVAVKEGNAVVKDVIIDGVPIKDYVDKNKNPGQ
jgi:uncharacterized membrane-anchored protein